MATVALAYSDKACAHNIDAAFGPFDVAFEKMIKIGMT